MANCTLTVDDVVKIQGVARKSGLSRAAFMQLFVTPSFQVGLHAIAEIGGTLAHLHPRLNLEDVPHSPIHPYGGAASKSKLSGNQPGPVSWMYLASKVQLIDPKDPLPDGWKYGNYALAEGLRLYGLFQPQWAWAKRSVPQVLLFKGTRFFLRSKMHEEHAKCYAVFAEELGVWRIQAGYLNMEGHAEKSVIYKP